MLADVCAKTARFFRLVSLETSRRRLQGTLARPCCLGGCQAAPQRPACGIYPSAPTMCSDVERFLCCVCVCVCARECDTPQPAGSRALQSFFLSSLTHVLACCPLSDLSVLAFCLHSWCSCR